ncbi:hypothetical protein LGK97_17270 [Clostridium sp. CS001]|uniref:hypothetical protein n=1 Tax=Clostridium sp. CS001 TaxID=2880648 RepID=UPI001CF122FC|nr:hypothetical protein [Clostridium sp. CS001]MCB2291476.1 hypothetical protein [Clostridium sp. CS001]
MVKTFKTIIFTCILVVSFSTICMAKEYTNYTELIENGKTFDNTKITLKGEAIGESMKRGEYSWVNISDGSNAIGIWIKSDQVEFIKNFGRYGHKGDTLSAYGTFNRACAEHGGDMDVHPISVKIEEHGGKVIIPISRSKGILAIMLAIGALSSIFLYKKFTKSISY